MPASRWRYEAKDSEHLPSRSYREFHGISFPPDRQALQRHSAASRELESEPGADPFGSRPRRAEKALTMSSAAPQPSWHTLPTSVFHQNMRTFNGITPDRVAKFASSFNSIGYRANQRVVVAGFTELLKCDDNMNSIILCLASQLHWELTNVAAFAVGRTIGSMEYAAISWNPAMFKPDCVGGMFLCQKVWTCVLGDPGTELAIPADADVDTRGLVFLAAKQGGKAYVYGFMHNMYAVGDRSGAFQNLENMHLKIAAFLQSKKGYPSDIEFYIGGDFNVSPHKPRSKGELECHAATTSSGAFLNTTNSNPYDFFLSNNGQITSDNVQVWASSRQDRASDHAGISMTIPDNKMDEK
jgi:hypothetical protein